jgi:hypothetical protein
LDSLFRDLKTAQEQGASEKQIWVLLIDILTHPMIAWAMHSRHHSASRARKKIWNKLRRFGGMSSTEIARAFNVTKRIVNKALRKR